MKTKTYLNNNELIEQIIKKGIIIENEEKVKKILKQNNYYVIMGYRHLFLNENGKYNNVNFNNIYNLYLLDIENIIKMSVVNRFCSQYGFKEEQYLNKNNYNLNHKYINKTIAILKNQIKENGKNHTAIIYYKQKYGFIPFWVVSKVISFGLLRELYSIMKDIDKKYIKENKNVTLENLLKEMNLPLNYINLKWKKKELFSY